MSLCEMNSLSVRALLTVILQNIRGIALNCLQLVLDGDVVQCCCKVKRNPCSDFSMQQKTRRIFQRRHDSSFIFSIKPIYLANTRCR